MKKQSEKSKKYGVKYFARRLKTPLKWDDLVLPEHTLEQVKELEAWLQHGDALLGDWDMRGKAKPGFRALFQGPSGTDKTLAASLLGKSTGRDIYRVDLSAIVSKYIGETEKNLARVFSTAEKKNWILFFDEADALFGKRTDVKDSHDRYANQGVAYLLRRLDTYTGLAILATNLPENIDDAFGRRFQSIITFPLPDAAARLTL